MTRILLVPGRGIAGPRHWLRLWADAHPEYRWAPEPPGPPLVLKDRVAALHRAIAADDESALIVAHSAGCVSTVVWAATHTGPARGALLATPTGHRLIHPGRSRGRGTARPSRPGP